MLIFFELIEFLFYVWEVCVGIWKDVGCFCVVSLRGRKVFRGIGFY